MFNIFKFYFPIAVATQYYFTLVSGVQRGGQTLI